MAELHLDAPSYGTVQLEKVELTNDSAKRADCKATDMETRAVVPHVPFPHWKTVDKDIPVAPQGEGGWGA